MLTLNQLLVLLDQQKAKASIEGIVLVKSISRILSNLLEYNDCKVQMMAGESKAVMAYVSLVLGVHENASDKDRQEIVANLLRSINQITLEPALCA